MNRKRWMGGLAVLAISGAVALAVADEAPIVLADATPINAAPAVLPVAVGGGAQPCALPLCPAADQACRQDAFALALECLGAGLLEAHAPAPGTTVFRAHGGGYTLYGALSMGSTGKHEAALRALADRVEASPIPRPAEPSLRSE